MAGRAAAGLLGFLGRTVRGTGRFAGRAAPAAGLGALGLGVGALGMSMLGAAGRNGGGTSGNSASASGLSSGGSLVPISGTSTTGSSFANDNTYERVSANSNADPLKEIARISAISATKLSSIDNTLKNILSFHTSQAAASVRAARERSLESGPASAMGGAYMQETQPRPSRGGSLLGLAAAGAGLGILGAAANAANKARDTAGNAIAGGQNLLERSMQPIADAATGFAYAGDARRSMRGISVPPMAAGLAAANDNAPGRLLRFLRGLKGIGGTLGRSVGPATAAFAAFDPIIALIQAGGDINNEEVKKQTVGAIAAILGGAGGVAAGAAIGALVGSVVPVAGTVVGFFAGGLLGAVASLGAEFIAENLYDLVVGKITARQFMSNIQRGAIDGIRRVPAIAAGAGAALVTGIGAGVAAGARGAAGLVSRIPGAAAMGNALVRATGVAAIVGAGMLVARQVSGPEGSYTPNSESNTPSSSGPLSSVKTFHDRAVQGGEGADLYLSAKNKVEVYLGRRLTGREWTSFIHAVHAETGRNPVEDAMIAGSILNRAKNPRTWAEPFARRFVDNPHSRRTLEYLRTGETVLAVLFAPNQFHAVTGVRPQFRPSIMYSTGPSETELVRILTSIDQHLMKVPTNQVEFGANDPRAYVRGTNIRHRNRLLEEGGAVIGRSVFNTAGLNNTPTTGPRGGAQPMPAPIVPNTNNVQNSSTPAGGYSPQSGNGNQQSPNNRAGPQDSGYNPNEAHEGQEGGERTSSDNTLVLPTSGTVSSVFGTRIHPISRRRSHHNGVDIVNRVGTPVVSAGDGVVETVAYQHGDRRNPGGGKYIWIRHPDGRYTGYMHLNTQEVSPGDQVSKGQRIGTVGNTGGSTGPHLHFEIRRGRRGAGINPSTIFPELRTGNNVNQGSGAQAPALSNRIINRAGGQGNNRQVGNPQAGAYNSGALANIAPAPNPTNTNLASIDMNSTNLLNRFNPNNQTLNRVAQQAPAQNVTIQNRTGSAAAEPVDSPVNSQYNYALYWQ